MGSNVIKYGPATLARLVAELEEPITNPIANPITNPAPIEHGLVMDAATLIAATAWRETLAANLAVGGAMWAAHTGIDDPDGGGKWWPGLGRPAPGWER